MANSSFAFNDHQQGVAESPPCCDSADPGVLQIDDLEGSMITEDLNEPEPFSTPSFGQGPGNGKMLRLDINAHGNQIKKCAPDSSDPSDPSHQPSSQNEQSCRDSRRSSPESEERGEVSDSVLSKTVHDLLRTVGTDITMRNPLFHPGIEHMSRTDILAWVLRSIRSLKLLRVDVEGCRRTQNVSLPKPTERSHANSIRKHRLTVRPFTRRTLESQFAPNDPVQSHTFGPDIVGFRKVDLPVSKHRQQESQSLSPFSQLNQRFIERVNCFVPNEQQQDGFDEHEKKSVNFGRSGMLKPGFATQENLDLNAHIVSFIGFNKETDYSSKQV